MSIVIIEKSILLHLAQSYIEGTWAATLSPIMLQNIMTCLPVPLPPPLS